MSRDSFRHSGEVVAIDSETVSVEIVQNEACDGCRAKGKCGVIGGGESGKRSVMRIVNSHAIEFSVGERVEVSITYRVGMIAVVFTYLIPLLIFVGALGVLISMEVDEGVAAVSTFVALGIYYGVLYMFRERFERVVQFDIRRVI